MSNSLNIIKCERKLNEFIQGRIHDINQGTETPRLSATLIKKYAKGMADALSIIYDDSSIGNVIIKLMEDKLSLIDPHWVNHETRRLYARPADLKFG